MSIQAVAWALEQDFSYVTLKGHKHHAHAAKLVLISLANHADHVSGHCWPSAETIGREACVTPRGVYRIVADLERNGFIDIKRVRGKDGKQRSNNYWIRFERQPRSWQYYGDPGDDEPFEPDEPGDMEPPGGIVENSPENDSENATESPGPSDIGVTRQESLEPSVLEPSMPAGFAPSARADEQAKLQAAEEARKPKRIPIIEGSRPWEGHVKAGHPRTLVGLVEVDGKLHRGWYFEASKCNGLYPKPKQTGPPASDLMSPEDEEELAKQWG
jgi:hypothetical protein